MQLLLFLSALLAGLTGAISGDRCGIARVEQGTAIARTAETVAETVAAVTEVGVTGSAVTPILTAIPAFALHDVPAALPARLTSGRRLE